MPEKVAWFTGATRSVTSILRFQKIDGTWFQKIGRTPAQFGQLCHGMAWSKKSVGHLHNSVNDVMGHHIARPYSAWCNKSVGDVIVLRDTRKLGRPPAPGLCSADDFASTRWHCDIEDSDIGISRTEWHLEYQGQWHLEYQGYIEGKNKIWFKKLTAFIASFLNMCVALKRAVCCFCT